MRAYKQLKVNEHASREDPVEIRPLHHRLAERVRAHVFLCTLACYVQFELTRRLEPMLFTDDTPLAPTNPVAPSNRSPQAAAKAGSARTPTDNPPTASKTSSKTSARCAAHDPNRQQRIHLHRDHPHRTQHNAFELAGVNPGK